MLIVTACRKLKLEGEWSRALQGIFAIKALLTFFNFIRSNILILSLDE